MKFTMQRLLGAQRSRRLQGLCLTLALGTMPSLCLAQGVKNGDFSAPPNKTAKNVEYPITVEGWKTTDKGGKFEIWGSGFDDSYSGRVYDAPPNTGIKQFAEVAAFDHSTLSQVVTGIPDNSEYGFSFWHRGRHKSDTEEDTIEVTVKEGNNVLWKKRFFATAKAWIPHTETVGIKKGSGAVTVSFESINSASGNPAVGNLLTGIKLDATVKPPACVVNAGGTYEWTTDNTGIAGTDGKLNKLGPAMLNVADQKVSGTGRTGVWQVTSDCTVYIDWEPGNFRDILKVSADGKTISGKNQFGTKIQGVKK